MKIQSNWTDREYDLWKFQFDKILDGVQSAGKAMHSFSIYLLMFVAFTEIVILSNVLGTMAKLPILGFELDRWSAGIAGAVFISLCMLGFSISRAYHTIRISSLIIHLKVLFDGIPVNHPLYFKAENYAYLVIEPSIYNFIDSIERPLSIHIFSTILEIIWIMAVPFFQGHIIYIIFNHYSSNISIIILLIILAIITLFSLFKIAIVNEKAVDWGKYSLTEALKK